MKKMKRYESRIDLKTDPSIYQISDRLISNANAKKFTTSGNGGGSDELKKERQFNGKSDFTSLNVSYNNQWKDRPNKMKCRTCVFFVLKTATSKMIEESDHPITNLGTSVKYIDNDRIGRCRCRAPTMRGFPVVFQNDWCGRHRLDENKI